MMWLLQTPMRTYGQAKSSDHSQNGAPSTASPSPNASNSCDCSDSWPNRSMSFGADSFAQQFDRQKVDQQVQQALEKVRHEVEAAMKSENWRELSSLPDLHELQAELRETIPQALQEAERKVIEISPMDTDEDAGWLGVEISEITSDQAQQLKLPEERGVLVISVEPDSPAAKAGIREKDVILSYGDEKIEGVAQFRRLIRETPPGRQIRMSISREGNAQTVPVNIAGRPNQFMKHSGPEFGFNMPPLPNFPDPDHDYMFVAPDAMGLRTPMLGISAEDLSGQLGAYFGTPNGEGVLVRDVKSGSSAEKAGLRAGDVIVKLDDKTVRNLRDLRADLREKSDHQSVQLGLLRKGSSVSVTIPIEKPRPMENAAPVRRAQL